MNVKAGDLDLGYYAGQGSAAHGAECAKWLGAVAIAIIWDTFAQ